MKSRSCVAPYLRRHLHLQDWRNFKGGPREPWELALNQSAYLLHAFVGQISPGLPQAWWIELGAPGRQRSQE